MNTYKRTVFNLIKNLIYAICGPIAVLFIVYFICSLLKMDTTLGVLISAAAAILSFVYLVYTVLFNENIYIEVDDKEMRYFVRGNQKATYDLMRYRFGYRTVTSSGTTDTIKLKIYDTETDKESYLDCQPLGPNQFHRMYEDIKSRQELLAPVVEAIVED